MLEIYEKQGSVHFILFNSVCENWTVIFSFGNAEFCLRMNFSKEKLLGSVSSFLFSVSGWQFSRITTVNCKLKTENILLLLLPLLSGCLGHLPSKDELKKIQNYTASEVYSKDSVLLGRYFIENRTNANFGEISPNIINALIATEDVRFYKHEGVDTRSLFRVLIKTILLGDETSGGGSTISQQLAKNLYKRKTGFLSMMRNKMREATIAHRLEDVYSKNELLTLYLNTVSFGEEVYGIETAAERYFKTRPKDVNIQQAATLVGMLKAPSLYNPRTKPENSISRRNTVIAQMAKYNYITQAVSDSIKALPLGLNYNKLTHETGLAAYFREMLRLSLDKQIEDYNGKHNTQYNLYTDGLKIYTTIDSRMQQYAEDAMRKHMAELQLSFDEHWKTQKPWDENPKILKEAIRNSAMYKTLIEQGLSGKDAEAKMKLQDTIRLFTWQGDTVVKMSFMDSLQHDLMLLQSGVLAMNPSTGEIKAWVGGIDFSHFKYDHVTSQRQVGSTFKPIIYAAALENGLSPCDFFVNEQKTYPEYENWTVDNPGGYGGYYSMQGALTYSINTIAVEVLMQTGILPVINLAKEMGIKSELPAVPSLALGSADISLFDMTTAYCAFANNGSVPEAKFLLQVIDRNGNALIDQSNKELSRRAITSSTAETITHFLQSVVDSGTASSLRNQFGFTFDIAGKTGTTQNHTDGWFIGYTPDLVCGAWVGADNPQTRFRSLSLGQGSKMALPIWGYFMQKVTSDSEFLRMKQRQFEHNFYVLASLDCPMYKEYENFWERLFGKKNDKPRNDEGEGDELESQNEEKKEKLTLKERLKRAFGKKEK